MKEAVLKVYDLRGKARIMYGLAYISAVVEANEKAVKKLKNEEKFGMGKMAIGKVMEELLQDRLQER